MDGLWTIEAHAHSAEVSLCAKLYGAETARGVKAAGCDALMIEVHNDPPHAKCDGPQSLRPEAFDRLARKVRAMRSALTSAEGVEA